MARFGARVGDAVAKHARSRPDSPAVVEPGGASLSYRALIRLADEEAARLRARSAGDPVPVVASSGLEYLAKFIGAVRAGRAALCPPEGTSPARAAELEAGLPALPENSGELFYVGLTSGSTGEPKAVLRAHDSWLQSFELMSELFGAPQRAAVAGSLSFSGVLISALHTLHEGGELWLLPRTPERRTLELMDRERITSAFMVPALLRALAERSGRRVSAREITLVTAGARLDIRTRAALAGTFPAARLFEYYGSAEMGFVTYMDPGAGSERPDSVGRLCPGVECELRGEDGTAAPRGVLYARSPYQFSGYAGEEPVPPGGWVTAGDWAEFDSGGYLYLLGRSEERINVGGLKVFAAEVERAIVSHPAIEEAAAMALPDRLRGQVTAAAVVTAPGAEVSALALRRWCAHSLPSAAVPRRIAEVSALPRNAGGKLDREALLEMLAGQGRRG